MFFKNWPYWLKGRTILQKVFKPSWLKIIISIVILFISFALSYYSIFQIISAIDLAYIFILMIYLMYLKLTNTYWLTGGLIGFATWVFLMIITPPSNYAGSAGPIFVLPIFVILGIIIGFAYGKIKKKK